MAIGLGASGRRSVVRDRPRRRGFRWTVYLVLLPAVGFLAVFAYYPAVSGLWHSLYDWRPGFDSPFAGLSNYREMIHDSLWWQSFRNLGIMFVFSVTVKWLAPLLVAELIITVRNERARFVYRTLLIVPLAFPGVVTVLIWGFMYDPNNGVINRLLTSIHLSGLTHNWIGDPKTALGALLFIGFPWIASLQFLIFLAALSNIPAEIFEAAELDGLGRFRRFFTIDVPLMASQLRLLFFLAVVSVLQYGFAAYLVTGGGPNNATQVPVLRMLGVAFQGQSWGYAAALSSTLFLLALLVSAAAALSHRRGTTTEVQGL